MFGRIDEVKKEYLTDSRMDPEDVNQNYWDVPLDRIVNVEVLKETPFIPRPENYGQPFAEIIGVTNNECDAVEEVHFHVHGLTANYLNTKPLHVSQVSQWIDENTLDVRLKVKINMELKQVLLSYTPFITILSPQSLVEEHKAALRKALEQYA